MLRRNCWEIKECGREPGGAKVAEMGSCPAATESRADGLNGGTNGGRVCWVVSGTFCGGAVQGTFAKKLTTCTACNVYRQIHEEEGEDRASLETIRRKLEPPPEKEPGRRWLLGKRG